MNLQGKQALVEKHDRDVQDLQIGLLIRIAGVPLVVSLMAMSLYVHNFAFTLVYVASAFVVLPCASMFVFFFSKFTRNFVAKTIMKQLFGFDDVAVVVIQQFCSASVAVSKLTEEVHRYSAENIPKVLETGQVPKHPTSLDHMRRVAALRFVQTVSNRIKSRIAAHRPDKLSNPLIYVTGNLECKTL